MSSPARAAEFPNDNPALHQGAVWVCAAPCAPPRPVVRAPTPALAVVRPPRRERSTAVPSAPLVPEAQSVPHREIAAPGAEHTERRQIAPPGAEPTEHREIAVPESGRAGAADPFSAFVRSLVSVALAAGATRAAAILPSLLHEGRLDDSGFDAARAEALVEAGIARRSDAGLRATDDFSRVAGAWRAVLRGESDDLSTCGAQTLDAWGASLLAAFLGAPERAEGLRRDLRRRGVAAFGILEQAA